MARSITSGVFAVAGTKVVVLLLGLATSPLLTRLLGDGYGDYAFLLSAFSLFMLFVSSGITDGVRKHVAEDRSYPNWKSLVAGFYLRAAVALALVGAAVLAAVAYFGVAAALLGPRFTTYCYLLAALVVAAQLRAYTRRTLMGFDLEPYSESLKVLHKALFVAAGVGLAWLGYGVAGALAGQVIASLATAFLGFLVLTRRVDPSAVFKRLPRSVSRREFLAFNGMSVFLVLLLTSLYQVDVLMLRPIAGAEPTKYYKVALVFAELVWFVPTSLQTVLLHSTSSLWASGDGDRVGRLAARVTRYTVLLTALLAVGIAALARDAIPILYPDEYVASVTPLLVLLPGAVGFAMARPILAVGQGKGDLKPLVAATGVAAVLNLVLNLVLIPRFGTTGAAVSTSVGYGSMAVLHVLAARRVGFDPLSDFRPLAVGTTVLIGGAATLWTASALANSTTALLVVPVVGLLAFAVLAFLTGALDTAEVGGVASNMPGISRLVGIPSTADATASAASLAQKTLLAVGVVLFAASVGLALSGAPVTSVPTPANDTGNTTVAPTTTPTTTPTPTTTTAGTTAANTTQQSTTTRQTTRANTTTDTPPPSTTTATRTTRGSTTTRRTTTYPTTTRTTRRTTTYPTTTRTTTQQTTTYPTTTYPTTTQQTTTNDTTTSSTTTSSTTTSSTTTQQTTTNDTTTSSTTTSSTTTNDTTTQTTTNDTTTSSTTTEQFTTTTSSTTTNDTTTSSTTTNTTSGSLGLVTVARW